jgi:hypothetical protein
MAQSRQKGIPWKRTAAGAGIGAVTGAGLGYGRVVGRHAQGAWDISRAFPKADRARAAVRSAAYAATSPRKSYMFAMQSGAKKMIAGAALVGAAVGVAAVKAWQKGERGGTYYLTVSGRRVYRRG